MANYDLYTELQLDKDMPPREIAEVLDSRLSDLRGRGFSGDSPEVDQMQTARAILGDPYKRDLYEAALNGPQDDVVNIRWLHDLADTQSPNVSGGYDLVGHGAGQGVDPDVTRENPVVSEQEPLIGQDAPDLGESPTETVQDAPDYQDALDNQEAQDAQDAPAPNSWQQPAASSVPGGYRGPQHAAPNNQFQQAPGQAPGQAQGQAQRQTPQLDTSTWGVGSRSRSESKLYLSLLAVIVVGMIYPLIVLLTAGASDVNAGLSVMKATLFTLAHVAAWVSINEIIWGVRKIVAPDNRSEQ